MTPFLAMPFPCLAPALRLARLGSCDGHVLSAEGMPPDGISPLAVISPGVASVKFKTTTPNKNQVSIAK